MDEIQSRDDRSGGDPGDPMEFRTPEGQDADARWDNEGGSVGSDADLAAEVAAETREHRWTEAHAQHWHTSEYTTATRARAEERVTGRISSATTDAEVEGPSGSGEQSVRPEEDDPA